MKIIAQVTDDRVLVEMTGRELANIVGKDYERQLEPTHSGYGSRRTGLEVGTEYKVSDIYNRLRQQEKAADRLELAKSHLRAVADLLDVIDPAAVIVGPTPEEGGAK